jgi:hypothetical protein
MGTAKQHVQRPHNTLLLVLLLLLLHTTKHPSILVPMN